MQYKAKNKTINDLIVFYLLLLLLIKYIKLHIHVHNYNDFYFTNCKYRKLL